MKNPFSKTRELPPLPADHIYFGVESRAKGGKVRHATVMVSIDYLDQLSAEIAEVRKTHSANLGAVAVVITDTNCQVEIWTRDQIKNARARV